MWLVVGLESGIPWPTERTTLEFEGCELTLRPETDQLAPTLVLQYTPPMQFTDALARARRFLSALAWSKRHYIREIGTTGGTHPIQMGKGGGLHAIAPGFRADYLPRPTDQRARLALALYREAMGLNNHSYEFLGYYKVINLLNASGPAQIQWINENVGRLEDPVACERREELPREGRDIGDYLFVSGRCAVAHAFADPTVDPDDPEDTLRLARDLMLMRALAEFAIERELGVPSMTTVWREHLYELEGFKALLGDGIVETLKANGSPDVRRIPPLPALSIRLRDFERLPTLEGLRAEAISATEGTVVLRCTSEDGLVQAFVGLNIPGERLEFDPLEGGVHIEDDGTVLAAERNLDLVKFVQRLYGNGEIEVWNAETEDRLGRCNPFIPVNLDFMAFDRNIIRAIARLQQAIETRRTNT